jgi:hypothetical protein
MASTLARLESSRFLPVGMPKALGYATAVNNQEALHYFIVEACQTICNTLSISEQMQWPMMKCVKACS